ncbi:pilus assembly FimT family protein [Gemmatimonas sp.]
MQPELNFMIYRPSAMPPRGYSLIELLIAIAMIGILAAIVLPRVRVERSQVDAAARTIGMALLTARSEAVARGHNVLVVLDTGNLVVRTVWDMNNNRRVDASEKSRPFLIGERVKFGRGAGIPAFEGATAQVPNLLTTGGMPMLVVQRNGALDRAGTLYLTSGRGAAGVGDIDSRAVRLDRATGRPTVYVFAQSGWRRQ